VRCFRFGHALQLTEALIGGAAIRESGRPLPDETLEASLAADATLLGAVGLPEFDGLPPEKRPEKGLLLLAQSPGGLRKPAPDPGLPRPPGVEPAEEPAGGRHRHGDRPRTDLRPLLRHPRGISGQGPETRAVNTLTYSWAEIERIAHMAFQLARGRRRKVTSVDKANVLENSQLWRAVVNEVGAGYPTSSSITCSWTIALCS